MAVFLQRMSETVVEPNPVKLVAGEKLVYLVRHGQSTANAAKAEDARHQPRYVSR